MKPNPGHCPPEAIGKRVRVRLAWEAIEQVPKDRAWPADGKGAVNWEIENDGLDVAEYEVIG